MKGIRSLIPLLAALVLATPASGARSRVTLQDLPPCEDLLPAVLRVAVPSRVAPASEVDAVRAEVRRALQSYLSQPSGTRLEGTAECRGARSIQINIAVGNDYEILDWLSEGEVDGALAAPLSLWLLERDGTRVEDIEPPASPSANPVSRFAVGRRTGQWPDSGWEPEDDPRGFLEEYREGLFCQALTTCDDASTLPPEVREPCQALVRKQKAVRIRPVMPDHLSTRGFVLPMSSNSIWLEKRIETLRAKLGKTAETRTLLPQVRQRFWSGWMQDLRFSLDHDPFERMAPAAGPGDPPSSSRSLDIPCCSPRWRMDRGEVVEILFSGRPRESRDPGAVPNPGQALISPNPYDTALISDGGATAVVQDRWVLLQGALERQLRSTRRSLGVELPMARIPPAFKAILEPRGLRDNGTVEILPPPRELAGLLDVNPRFGIRSMAFTPDETLRLIQAQKAGREGPFASLALILPGGGVKSAYQAVLLDRLYGSGSLRNFLVDEAPDLGQRPLDVHQVIGTSGGALTGYFVAQLGPQGPWNLTELLWHKGPAAGAPPLGPEEKSPPLRSSDIFAFSDLLRYLSVVVNFAVFCALLVGIVYRERLRGHRRIGGAPAGRRSISWLLWSVLLATPLLMQLASAGGYREHVPEIEGAAYMLLVLLVMMADQCIVSREDEPSQTFWIHWRVPVLAGFAFLVVPLGLQLFLLFQRPEDSSSRPSPATEHLSLLLAGESASVGLVFFLLTIFILLAGLAIPLRRLRPSWSGTFRSVAPAALDAFLCSFLALTLFVSQAVRAKASWRPPVLLSVLVVLVLGILLLSILRPLMQRKGLVGWVPYYGSLFAMAAIVFYLCMPENPGSYETLREILLAPSGFDVFGGHLMVMIGMFLLTGGLIQALIQGRNTYRPEGENRFMRGLLLLLGHAVAVLAILYFLDWLMTKLSDRWTLPITTLELDWRYWVASISLAGLLGLFLLGLRKRRFWQPVARRLRGLQRKGLAKHPEKAPRPQWHSILQGLRRLVTLGFLKGIRWLRHSALFLLESHPNRPLISVRAFRMLTVGAAAVLWWNLLLAPATYGNRRAEATLQKTIARFEDAYGQAHGAGPSDDRLPYQRAEMLQPRFRAHFVSPANELQEDGTRFFLFSPHEAKECPEVPRRSRSGSQWFAYEVFQGAQEAQRSLATGAPIACSPLDNSTAAGKSFLTSVIFASGSPFPIFAPHRVREPGSERESMILVDGGYSNNVPVEAALEMDARQVLILRSAHPSPMPAQGGFGEVIANRLGPLVSNLPRIPAFLFERSQQVDRLSSQDVFVVSLAPLPDHPDWPALFHFQKSVVERLEKIAGEDMQARIGFVESWGRPETRLSITLLERRGPLPRDLPKTAP